MKRTLQLLLIFSTFFQSCFAQTEEERKKIDSAVDTAIKDYFENPSKFQETLNPEIIKQFPDSGKFENGIKTGLWVEYTIDSLVSNNGALVVGDKQMPLKTSYFIKKDVGKYQKGIRDGNWILYNCFSTKAPFDFQRRDVRNYKNGKLDGEEIYYQGYGIYQTPLAICNWKNGVKDGIGKEYDYNYPYKLQLLYKIIDGKTVLQQSFHPNGKIKDEQTDTIINGKELLFAKNYLAGGQLKYTGYFINNETPYGIWTNYYENGKIESIDNKINGNYKYYFDNGQLCFESVYKNGKLMEVISNFTKDGKRNNPGTIKNGTGTLNLYEPDGKLSETAEYIDGIEKK